MLKLIPQHPFKMKLIVLIGIIATAFGTPAPYRDPMINEGLFEGDIMGIDPYADRSAVLKDEQRWPEGIVPYVISPEREDIKKLILESMSYLEAFTCIRFVERTTEKDYIKIVKDDGCSSHWGRSGKGEQPISIGEGCDHFAIIVHELVHTLGFEHEHNRPDRDDHITIHWDNIADNFKSAFKKLRPEQTRILAPFDFSSIMMYGSLAFSKDKQNFAITSKDGRKIDEIQDRNSMSVRDVEKITKLYNCPKKDTE